MSKLLIDTSELPEVDEVFNNYFEACEYGLKQLTDEQRMELFLKYCKHCGCDDPKCQCWNDD